MRLEPAGSRPPSVDSAMSPSTGYEVAWLFARRMRRRVSVPLAHKRPSPSATPDPPLTACVPWKKVTKEFDTPFAVRTSESALTEAFPDAAILAPLASKEFAQPRSLAP